ncbi:hypothetical protein J2755_000389 [Methanohalophilus levihalophilus]|uniref:hypothetical protein n=1 Tax=Methanohalophilus levihalophilus TaxID=1431282 RepID=UPI001AE9F711|nr:hypothetical protein [Methanohalophilus levihalophilus]MBP2029469.1 hypothetical protein [Methanohalophilus levihalophilus]
MSEFEISKKTKVILFSLLLLLNIILRIPSIPHEKGADSFFIHSLANSISTYGLANWWVHWLSVFGFYPYSYASAVPFSLSGMSQLLDMNMETTILLFSIFIGLFSIFVGYSLAGLIYNDFVFKYLMAMFFSISQGIMIFSTWEISARGPFMIFLPFFIFILLKKIPITKKILFTLIILIFIFSIHHYAWFTLPILFAYIALKVISNIERIWSKQVYLNYLYAIGFCIASMLPFFEKSLIVAGSRYDWILTMLVSHTRFVGPLIVFALGGLIYLILNKNKNIAQWLLLSSVLSFAPFFYNINYGVYVGLLFLVFLGTVGFWNLFKVQNVMTSRILTVLIVLNLLFFVSFSSFYNHERTGEYQHYWYMSELTFHEGNWINDHIEKDKRVLIISENSHNVRSIALQTNGSSVLQGGTEGLAYGFIDSSFVDNLTRVPYTSSYFYSESPYQATERDIYRSIEWYILAKDIRKIKEVYDLDYFVQSLTYRRPAGFSTTKMDRIYTNGLLEVYEISDL